MAVSLKHNTNSLRKLSIEIAPEAEEAVIELLSAVFGQSPSVYSNLERQKTTASVFVSKISPDHRAQVRNGLANIQRSGLNIGSAHVQVRAMRRENWAESWKRHFKPIEIGDRLVVLPSWSRRKPKRGQAKVILDPGLSFGTGHHPTTAFCLTQIAALRDKEVSQSMLDVGCGSGILSIAAAKLGYSPVIAFDFDPDAVRVARENAKLNGVQINIFRRDLTQMPTRTNRRFHVVCANLIYDVLIREREKLLSRLAPDGTLVLAGILKEQFPKVQRSYCAAGLKLVASRTAKEWRSGALRFRH